MTNPVPMTVKAGGRSWSARAFETQTGWRLEVVGQRETLQAVGRTITAAGEAVAREIETRLKKRRA